MVGAIVRSPTDAASQEPVVGSATACHSGHARGLYVTQPYSIISSTSAEFELEGSARSVVQFEGLLPEAASCVAYAPVDLDGQAGILVDIPPAAYKLVRLVVHLARCLYAEYGGGLRHPLRA